MKLTYSNLPLSNSNNSSKISYDTLYTKPLEIETGTLSAMKGLFTSRGFDDEAAESVSVVIIRQAKFDGYNPMQIMDTLKGLDSVEISALVAEIINFNRYKTSFLGYALEFTPNSEVARNVLP